MFTAEFINQPQNELYRPRTNADTDTRPNNLLKGRQNKEFPTIRIKNLHGNPSELSKYKVRVNLVQFLSENLEV